MSIDILSALATPAGLAALAGAIIAGVFILIPPARAWFAALSADEQSALTAWLIVLLGALAIALSCGGALSIVACSQLGIVDYIGQTLIVAVLGVVSNRAVFQLARIVKARGAMQGASNSASEKGLEAPSPARAKLLD